MLASCSPSPGRDRLDMQPFQIWLPGNQGRREDCYGGPVPPEIAQIGRGDHTTVAIGDLRHTTPPTIKVSDAVEVQLQPSSLFAPFSSAKPTLIDGSLERSGIVGYGGFVAFTIDAPANYRIAANWRSIGPAGGESGASFELLRLGDHSQTVLPFSTSSVPCRIYRVLDYYLVPGDYVLQLTTTSTERVSIVLAPAVSPFGREYR
jgi:hypothetical protein